MGLPALPLKDSAASGDAFGSPCLTMLPQVEFAHAKKQEPVSDPDFSLDQPDFPSYNAAERTAHAIEIGNSSPNFITRSCSTCSCENDLEIGLDNAVSQYQNGAFTVLSNAPMTNFAQRLIGKQGDAEQNSTERCNTKPSHRSVLPTLLDKHRQASASHRQQSPSKMP